MNKGITVTSKNIHKILNKAIEKLEKMSQIQLQSQSIDIYGFPWCPACALPMMYDKVNDMYYCCQYAYSRKQGF